MKSMIELQEEIRRTRQHLSRLESRYYKAQAKTVRYSQRERVELAKRELSKKYPNIQFSNRDMNLLRLVGTLPSVPLSKEKQETARAIAARYK
ncbi:MAG TPA: hypothetical protein VK503_11335 [Candidatus Bathyarchaeia archaeon]|nr:hypothetical protein [Candidatus Bathyarchaeia archaeon]